MIILLDLNGRQVNVNPFNSLQHFGIDCIWRESSKLPFMLLLNRRYYDITKRKVKWTTKSVSVITTFMWRQKKRILNIQPKNVPKVDSRSLSECENDDDVLLKSFPEIGWGG